MQPDFIQHDVDLTALNTLALPARARCFASIKSPQQLDMLVAASGLPLCRFILGGGSNLVLTGDFDGLMLHMAIMGRYLNKEDNEAWYVSAGAGENWHQFVQWTLAQGWPGLENLSLIPGTVGAAPIQNIGAYGLEVGEYIWNLETVDMQTGRHHTFSAAECRFAYRQSRFKQEGWHLEGRYAIVEVTFRLPKKWQPRTSYGDVVAELERQAISSPTPVDIARAITCIRQRKLPDPALIPNVGSFFHNPVVDSALAGELAARYPGLPAYPQPDGKSKLAAGWLIEQAGWKGRNLGAAGMYEHQALVMVNRGGAGSEDILALTAVVQNAVQKCFGIKLVPEPVFL